jgi:hypothetical protein
MEIESVRGNILLLLLHVGVVVRSREDLIECEK